MMAFTDVPTAAPGVRITLFSDNEACDVSLPRRKTVRDFSRSLERSVEEDLLPHLHKRYASTMFGAEKYLSGPASRITSMGILLPRVRANYSETFFSWKKEAHLKKSPDCHDLTQTASCATYVDSQRLHHPRKWHPTCGRLLSARWRGSRSQLCANFRETYAQVYIRPQRPCYKPALLSSTRSLALADVIAECKNG